MKYRKGLGKLTFRNLEQRHLTVDSSKYLKVSVPVKSLVKVALEVYEKGIIFYGKCLKGVPFLSNMVCKTKG